MSKKIVFLDANIFINCALIEARELKKAPDLNTLKDIKEKLDSDKMILILPENLKAEVNIGVDFKFTGIIRMIEGIFSQINKHVESAYPEEKKEGKVSKLVEQELEKSKANSIKELEKSKANLINEIGVKFKIILNAIDVIFKHKNTKTIELSHEILMAGIKRSALMKRPYSPPPIYQNPDTKNKKMHILKIKIV